VVPLPPPQVQGLAESVRVLGHGVPVPVPVPVPG
jgi:hypothetical protein